VTNRPVTSSLHHTSPPCGAAPTSVKNSGSPSNAQACDFRAEIGDVPEAQREIFDSFKK